MSLEENKQIDRRYQEIYNNNDLDCLTEVVSENLLAGGDKVAARIIMSGTH